MAISIRDFLSDGYKGDQGATGFTGSQGGIGYTGSKGPQGIQGETGAAGPAGAGVPIGGNVGQLVRKASAADYAVEWGATITISTSDPSGGADGDIWFKVDP